MAEGYSNVIMKNEIYEKLSEYHKKQNTQLKFNPWVSEFLLMNLEKDAFLQEYAPSISKVGITDNVLTLKDHKKNKHIEIRFVNGKLQSDDDDPIYLQYAMALPELMQLKR